MARVNPVAGRGGRGGTQGVDWRSTDLSRRTWAAGKGVSVRGGPAGATAGPTDRGEGLPGVERGPGGVEPAPARAGQQEQEAWREGASPLYNHHGAALSLPLRPEQERGGSGMGMGSQSHPWGPQDASDSAGQGDLSAQGRQLGGRIGEMSTAGGREF